MLQPVKLFSVFAPKNVQANQNVQPQYHVNFATKPDTFERTTKNEKTPVATSINFTGWSGDQEVRNLGNIVCPCCGIPMMTQKQMNDVTKHMGASARDGVKTLNNYEQYMHPVEKQCFNLLKEWSDKKPDSNFKELLLEHREPSLTRLQAKQNTIINTVVEMSKTLPENEQEAVKKMADVNKVLVASNDDEIKFKRKTFIKDVEDLKISDKDLHEKMKKEANKMPNSQNDVDSFIVKYASRGHKEIGERLVKLSVGTIEHIKPRSEGGKNQTGNYLLECGGCNHERSSIPLGDWVDMHPEMKENTQKYMDEVISRINAGKIKNFAFYPHAVAQTLLYQSDGKLDVDISKLNAPED